MGHIQKTTEALLILLLRLILLLLNGSLGVTGSRGRTGSGSGGSISIRIGNTVLELINLGPAELGLNGDSQNLLVGVDDRVHDGGQGGEVDRQGDGSNSGNALSQSSEELLLTNVEDRGREGLTLVVHLRDTHTIGEGRDVQQVEQGSLGGADLVTAVDKLEVRGDFNGTTSNLGGDTESLEKRGLAGLHTSVSSGNPDIGGSDGTSTSRCGNLVGQDLVTNLLEVVVGEDETDIALDERQKTLVLGSIGDEGPQGTTNLLYFC